MKIQVISDLHTEFCPYKISVNKDAEILVLAGDIVVPDNILSLKGMVKHIDIPIIYIAGNHEFYCKDPNITRPKILNALKSIADEIENLHFLDNETIVFGDVRFICSTLWSDFNLHPHPRLFAEMVNNAIGDFSLIHKTNTDVFNGYDCRDLCLEAKEFIDSELNKDFEGKTVVVTHFCCHRNSIHEMFAGSPLNPYFTTDCVPLLRSPVSLWIHGHTHMAMDYEVNGVRVFCNPRGYPREVSKYNGKTIVEI